MHCYILATTFLIFLLIEQYQQFEVDGRIFRKVDNKKNTAGLLYSKTVSSEQNCAIICHREAACYNFNVISADNGSLICQLNSATVQTNVVEDNMATLFGKFLNIPTHNYGNFSFYSALKRLQMVFIRPFNSYYKSF